LRKGLNAREKRVDAPIRGPLMERPSPATLEPIRLTGEPDFAIGDLVVRPSRGELVHVHGAERVEPRLMQVLVALAQANGGTVSRQELIARCWGGLSVSPDAVNRVISLLRHLLEASGTGARIETLTRIGYRLIGGPVAEQSDRGGAQPMRPFDPVTPLSGAEVPAEVGPLAWNLYARALVALEQPSREPIEQALAYLKQVVAQAPGFARGWAALAEAQRLMMLYLPTPMQAPARLESRRSAEQALGLDPGLGDAFGTIANLVPRFGHWREAEAFFLQGLAAEPDSAGLLQLHAQFLLSVGRTAEGAERLAVLRDRDPLSARIAVEHAAVLFDLDRTAEALQAISQAYALWPQIMLVWSECLRLHVSSNEFARAQALLDSPPSAVLPDDVNLARRRLHLIARRDRRPADLAAACRNFLDFARIGIAPATVAIYALASLDQPDAALSVADEIFREDPPQARAPGVNMMGTHLLAGQPDAIVLFRRDTANLRRLAGFETIAERIGLDAYWRESGFQPDFRTAVQA
jgi:DNA-binding winged helix-turn-helix (wHTH) protein/tetratricopeptide (TPR) repeat protein